MIKIYKGDHTDTQAEFEDAVTQYIDDLEQHKTTVGEPAPRPLFSIIHAIVTEHSGVYEWIDESKDEESFRINEEGLAQLAAEKLDAQTSPSTKYDAFRKSEYPDIGDGLDAFVKWIDQLRTEGSSINTETEAYVDACLAVKQRYPKP